MIAIGVEAAIECYSRLHEVLSRRCGADVANLFAEPVISRANGTAPTKIDWYSAHDGPVKPLSEVDDGTAASVVQNLRSRLATLRSLAYDSEIGPILVGALNLATPRGILSVGGNPLLIEWGMLPKSILDDTRARAALFAQTLGPYLVQFPTPTVSEEEWAADFGPSRSISAGQNASPQPGGRVPLVTVATRKAGLAAPAVAVLLAAVMLGVLMVPGVLDYGVDSSKASALEQSILQNLIRRQQALDAALATDCSQLTQLDPNLVPPAPDEIKVAPSTITELPVAPPGPPPSGPGQLQNIPPVDQNNLSLASRLERGVVMVDAGESSGSGFFVSPDTIVTNRHVVEGATSFRVMSKFVGIIPATLIKIEGRGDYEDLAALKVTPQHKASCPSRFDIRIRP